MSGLYWILSEVDGSHLASANGKILAWQDENECQKFIDKWEVKNAKPYWDAFLQPHNKNVQLVK